MSSVLIAEDQAAIAIALEDALTDGGYTVAGPFSRGSTAFEWLQRNTPDLALLDVFLLDGPCVELARYLRDRDVPFIFLTGEKDRGHIPADLHDCPWLEKPVTFHELINAVELLKARSARASS
jgi:DNA-binding response OmpR family regulator